MSWQLITLDANSFPHHSEPIATREEALKCAYDLARNGAVVSRLESSEGEMIAGDDLAEWCRRHSSAPT